MLTDKAVRNARAKDKPYRLSDERGLCLEVAPAGGRWWRLRYRFNGKAKQLSLGTYPDVSLADARTRRDDARKMLANGIDPSEHRKAMKSAMADAAGNSFEVIAREWFAKQSQSGPSRTPARLSGGLSLMCSHGSGSGQLWKSMPLRFSAYCDASKVEVRTILPTGHTRISGE